MGSTTHLHNSMEQKSPSGKSSDRRVACFWKFTAYMQEAVKITAFLMTHSRRNQLEKVFSSVVFWLVNSSATGLAVWEVTDVDDWLGGGILHAFRT